ncbi:phage scaffolding protein [Veillonella intestinalis]|uniref:phage scaffolding protein n=1 Tax=Veillonella intestinalis TaxID=2941341 RepID=UPI002040A565|nr:phage scaffolding protein [Veillonella intestinalis]
MEELLKELGITEDKVESATAAIKAYLDGSYVPKSRFNEVNTAKNSLEEQLVTRAKEMKALQQQAEGAKDVEALQKQINDLTQKQKTDQENYKSQLEKLKLDNAIALQLTGKAQDIDIVSGLINRDKLIVNEDGSITGLTEQVEALQKDKAFLFKSESNPVYTPKGGRTSTVNPFAAETENLTEQGKLFKENPAEARRLAAAAGIVLD